MAKFALPALPRSPNPPFWAPRPKTEHECDSTTSAHFEGLDRDGG